MASWTDHDILCFDFLKVHISQVQGWYSCENIQGQSNRNRLLNNTIIKVCKCLPLLLHLPMGNTFKVHSHVIPADIHNSLTLKKLNFLSLTNFLNNTFFCWYELSQDFMRRSASPSSIPSFLRWCHVLLHNSEHIPLSTVQFCLCLKHPSYVSQPT